MIDEEIPVAIADGNELHQPPFAVDAYREVLIWVFS